MLLQSNKELYPKYGDWLEQMYFPSRATPEDEAQLKEIISKSSLTADTDSESDEPLQIKVVSPSKSVKTVNDTENNESQQFSQKPKQANTNQAASRAKGKGKIKSPLKQRLPSRKGNRAKVNQAKVIDSRTQRQSIKHSERRVMLRKSRISKLKSNVNMMKMEQGTWNMEQIEYDETLCIIPEFDDFLTGLIETYCADSKYDEPLEENVFGTATNKVRKRTLRSLSNMDTMCEDAKN